MNKKILITGGNGFIARNLFDSFTNSFECVAPPREELDLLDSRKVFEYIVKNKFDVVVHTANYDAVPTFSTKDPDKVLEQNLRMFFNLAICRHYFGKMLFFGSGAEAGRHNWIPKMGERYIQSMVPPDQYGFSKHIMTEYARNSDNIYNLRLFSVFGEGDDWRYRTISNFCCKKALGKRVVVPKDQSRDFLYIKDLVNIVSLFIEQNPQHHGYNICSGSVRKDSEIARSLDPEFKYTSSTPIDLPEYSGDNISLLSEFPFLEFTPFDEALNNMVEYYEMNKASINEKKFEY